jgi:hypothetical protein
MRARFLNLFVVFALTTLNRESYLGYAIDVSLESMWEICDTLRISQPRNNMQPAANSDADQIEYNTIERGQRGAKWRYSILFAHSSVFITLIVFQPLA